MATHTSGSEEEIEFKIQPDIEKPSSNVWVLAADHPDVNNAIANAIVHGTYFLLDSADVGCCV